MRGPAHTRAVTRFPAWRSVPPGIEPLRAGTSACASPCSLRSRRFALACTLLLAAALRTASSARAADETTRPEAPAGEPLRILCLGDSYTGGGNMPPAQAYPARLEAALAAAHPQRRFDVINLGVAANTSSYLANNLERQLVEREPQLVIVWVGTNDAWNAMTGNDDRDPSRADQLPLEERGEELAPEVQQRIVEANLRRIADIAAAHETPLILIKYPLPLPAPNRALAAVARERRLPLLDPSRAFRRALREGHPHEHLLTPGFGPHPTALYYDYIGRALVPLVERALGLPSATGAAPRRNARDAALAAPEPAGR